MHHLLNSAEGLAKLKGGFAEGAITNQPHFDRLQADLEKAKKKVLHSKKLMQNATTY